MCGICGFNWVDGALLKKMVSSLERRGPDAQGKFEGEFGSAAFSLGHSRLKIIDLSDKAAQPMENEDGSLLLVFNGEIYNFRELRSALQRKGHRFKSASDGEVILHAYEEYGESCPAKFEGMFAFAVLDSKNKKLFAARDQAGIKPFYYFCEERNGSGRRKGSGRGKGSERGKTTRFAFASEVKALLQDEEFERVVDEAALSSLVENLFVTRNRTLFKGIRSLPPGCALSFSLKNYGAPSASTAPSVSRYWKPELRIDKARYASLEAAASELDETLSASVASTLVSDVPLGIALSGGLDSSVVAALAAKAAGGTNRIKTFTAGFDVEDDEYAFARSVAERVGSEHEELRIELRGLSEALPQVVWNLDFPAARTAVMPTFLLAKEMRKQVTVELIGEGGDELFAGYERHWVFARKSFAANANALKETFFKRGGKRECFADSVKDDEPLEERATQACPRGEDVNCALLYDFENQLPGVQLNRVDRMTMAHSVEARVPFLNSSVIEKAFQFPSSLKAGAGEGKLVLKKMARRYLPREIIERKKKGLSTPLSEWFDSEFAAVAEALLSEGNVRETAFLKPHGVKKIIEKNRLLRRVASPFRKAPGAFGRNALKLKNYYSGRLWFLANAVVWNKLFVEPEKIGVKPPGAQSLSRFE